MLKLFKNANFKNPYFDSSSLLNDIALFILTEKLILSKAIQIACLPVSPLSEFNEKAYASGWVSR